MPLRLNYFYKFDSKDLDEISQCLAAARFADDARGFWHHIHVAWLPNAGSPDEWNAGSFHAARPTWLLRLHFGGARAFRRRVAAGGAVHAGSGALAGCRNGLVDVEGQYAA